MSKSNRLGVIGGGQLGSLLCSAARKLNIKTVVLSDDKNAPAQNFVIILFIANMKATKK